MKKVISGLVILLLLATSSLLAQQKQNELIFEDYSNKFIEEVFEEAKDYIEAQKEHEAESKIIRTDLTGFDVPESLDEFTTQWHNDPVTQGISGMCWDYSTTSFFESEVYRLYDKKVKLSELWTAYWEYVEKARRFIRERGDSYFAEGSEADAVVRIWRKYGVVPQSAYSGLLEGQKYHDHRAMFKEMNEYLKSMEESNAWNEEIGLATIKAILNHYIGTPPETVTVDGKTMTPQEYLNDELKLNLDDYVGIISLKYKPYYEKIVYEVPDNWWYSDDYYNVPLDEYMEIVKRAIREGYTLTIGGDVSEPGKIPEKDCFVVPTFDIPAEYINEDSRQFRFSNETTTDDHGVHLVGYKDGGENGKDWYLIKDSGSSSRNGRFVGYYLFHEDYVKLKIIDYMVHKDMVGDILEKFEK